jgi:acyl carrier protein
VSMADGSPVTDSSTFTAKGRPVSESARLSELVCEVLRLPSGAVIDSLTIAETENWDSLAHIELIAALETEFSVELSADDIVEMITYAKIRSVLGGKGVAL